MGSSRAWSFLLLPTMMVLGPIEVTSSSGRHYHFSINDIKSEVFAGDLIFFLLFNQLSHPDISGTEQEKSLFYVYVSQVSPPVTYYHLQEIIACAIRIITELNSAPRWLHWEPRDPSTILHILQAWQSTVPGRYSCADFTKALMKSSLDKELYY